VDLQTEPTRRAIRSPTRRACALAELVEVLTFGEESAALTFGGWAQRCSNTASADALQRIALDEERHQIWVGQLSRELPTPAADARFRRRLRRFFAGLSAPDLRVHLVRVVALDTAACQLLGALRASGLPPETSAREIFTRIQRDEARHVVIARQLSAPLLTTRRGKDLLAAVREQLTELLAFRGAAFETLGVDADRLFARVRGVHRSKEVPQWVPT
jgi:rubrerythrin